MQMISLQRPVPTHAVSRKLPWAPCPGTSVTLPRRGHLPPNRRAISATREDRGAAAATSLDSLDSTQTDRVEPRDDERSRTQPAPGGIPAAVAAPPPPDQPPPDQPPPDQPPGFTARRLLVFSGLVLGYAAYYLTRNSLTYAAPVMVADPSLGFSLAQVGAMTSIFPIAYGLSKFVSGVLGDRYSPRLLLGGGLMATAACNLALGAGHGLTWFAAMWALNGLLQGVGAPSCARMLTSWFAVRERGTYWGLWNIAHNTGGFAAPLVAASAAAAGGWRWGMWAPGLAGLAVGLYVLAVCRDTPQTAGYNPVEAVQPLQTHAQTHTRNNDSCSCSSSTNGRDGRIHDGDGKVPAAATTTHAAAGATAARNNDNSSSSSSSGGTSSSGDNSGNSGASSGSTESSSDQSKNNNIINSSSSSSSKPGVLRTAIDNVLSNPYIWALALTYFFVYVVRQGVTSWSVFYLISEKGVPDAAQAAVRVSGLELGGLAGGLAAGRLSDELIRRRAAAAAAASASSAVPAAAGQGCSIDGGGRAAPVASRGAVGAGSVGTRVQVVMAYTAALAAALAAFQALPASAPPALQWLSVAAIGFCIYGPQMLIGLCGAELVHPASVGASQGVLGWVAYLGAANAGVPLSWLITNFGWAAYFTALVAACGVALLLLLPLVRLPSYSQWQQQQLQPVRT